MHLPCDMSDTFLVNKDFLVGKKRVQIKISNVENIPLKAIFGEHILDRKNLKATKKVNARFKNIIYNSDDLGENWRSVELDNMSEIKNVFTTISGNIIISGSDSENLNSHRITLLDKNLSELNTLITGKFSWHGSYSIDESDGCIMYGEYPPNKSSDKNKFPSKIMRSLDGGFTWEAILEMGYPEIRHFHTCNSIPFIENGWLVTSGDTPQQCKFLLSKDKGKTWDEINDIRQIPELEDDHFKNAIHRTVVMQFLDNEFIWATDDIIGPIDKYHEGDGKYDVKSKLIIGKIAEKKMNIEIISGLGMHVRSMIDIGEGWIFITEAKYLDKVGGPQVFIVLKNEIEKPYFLFEIGNSTSRITGGTYSRSSIKSFDGIFFTQMGDGMFDGKSSRSLRWEIELTNQYENDDIIKEINVEYLNLKKSYNKEEFWKERYFRPRKDLEKWKIPDKVNYDCDPFGDTNWMFQLNALRTLDPLMENGIEEKHVEYVVNTILQWDQFDKENLGSGTYRWHDMATGIRSEKIGYILNLLENNYPEKIIKISKLRKIAIEHHNKLMDEKFLSRGNHGVFQIHGLMALSNALGGLEYEKGEKYCEHNMEWFLKDQFFPDGFHSENSPEYHIYMISVFEKIIDSGWYSSEGISQLWENILEKACFLLWPDGNIIEIGDSNPSKVSKRYKDGFINEFSERIHSNKKFLENNRLMVKSEESGYTIVRSPFKSDEDNYMLMTVSAFRKRQHRHSDDLGFTLFENNEKIFVFPGKYSYGKTREREYVLKTKAHNCLEIDNIDFPRSSGHEYRSAVTDIQNREDEVIIQKMMKWDHVNTIHNRNIIYSPGEYIVVLDIFEATKMRNFKQWFHFGEVFNDSFYIDDNIIIGESENNTITGVMISSNMEEHIVKHYYQSEETLSGFISGSYNKLIPINTVCNEINTDEGFLGSIFSFKSDDVKMAVSIQEENVEVKINIDGISKLFKLEIF